jgi:hypothetical protein
MGLFDFLSQKDGHEKAEVKKTVPLQQPLNNRGSIRYPVNDIAIGAIGSIVEMAREGCKLRKNSSEQIDLPDLQFRLGTRDVRARILWQDEKFAGIEIAGGFDDAGFISKHMKRIKESTFRPRKKLSDDSIKGFMSKDPFSLMVNLMAELESPNTDMDKLKSMIVKLPGLIPEIAIKAGITKKEEELEIKDIDYAVKRLGLDTVKKLSSEFIKTRGEKMESAQSKDDLRDSMKVLKTVFFAALAPFFGFKDQEGLANNLLSIEYKGIDAIISKHEKIPKIKEFYNAPTKIYSEMSRFYERLRFGRDALNINRLYITTIRRALAGLYDGYLLAHLALNPVYTLDPEVKLSLTKINLNFSYVAYLTFIAAQAVIEKDRASAAVLTHRLLRTGMNEEKLSQFIEDNISEINRIMTDIGRTGNIKNPPAGVSLRFADYVPNEVHYERFIKYFKDFLTVKRMAIGYEDEAYAHFMLGKMLDSEDIGLNSKMFCVIPCENLSAEDMPVEAFSFFGIIVFKNIDKLNSCLLRPLVKLWNSFEGGIVLTFSKYSLIDFNNKDLFVLLRNHVIDFPSYFDDEKIYHKMLDHTAAYMKPCTEGVAIDTAKYHGGVFSMNNIRGSELLNIIPDVPEDEDDGQPGPKINPQGYRNIGR